MYQGADKYIINKTNYVIAQLEFSYCFYTPDHFSIRIIDPITPRYEVPK